MTNHHIVHTIPFALAQPRASHVYWLVPKQRRPLMKETMKAVTYHEYGTADVLQLKQDIPTPTPKRDEVLIQVHAATVTTGDVNMRGFTFVPRGFKYLSRLAFGLFRPRKAILGTEVAGKVVAIGQDVTRFAVGDDVFGIGSMQVGAYAEYVCRKAKGGLAHLPSGATYAEAAALPFGAGTALYFVQDVTNVQAGQHVLVNGASGGVGHYIVQIAKALGANVTGVCSQRNHELVLSLGADHVIDYHKEDFTQRHGMYDHIFSTVPGVTHFRACQQALTPNGRYIAVAGGLSDMWRSLWNKRIAVGTPSESPENIELLRQWFEEGKCKPFIDQTYPLAQIAEAHRYVDTGRKRGNVVILVS